MNYVYGNAPLVEVIAEIHWGLKKLDTAPDAKIDLYYDLFRDEFVEFVKSFGLNHIQELVPSIVPLEFLPNQPTIRLRFSPGKWPLAQLGPGVITANIVPPYNGWSEFKEFLHNLIGGLFKCYPFAEKTLHIEKLHLRYINAFDDNFEFNAYSKFAQDMLGINMPLSEKFLSEFVKEGTEVTYLLENRFVNVSPEGSISKIKIGPGMANNKKALILEFHCESMFSADAKIGSDEIFRWFSDAHTSLHKQFESLSTADLKLMLGDKREIQ